MKITESQLANIIKESTKKALAEEQLKNKIKKMVRESLESFGGFSQFEEDNDEKEEAPKKLKKSESGKADFNDENSDEQERRSQVEAFFLKDGVDIAPYAYELYGVERTEGEDTNEMKNARHKFTQCLHHEPNENGYPYSFTSAEINRLESSISAGRLSESINRTVKNAVKKVLK